jgi:DNA-binding IclR family transcriptional regulator
VKSESVRALARVPAAASTRSLSTARSVLRVLALLVQRPDGVRADEVAAALGKSVSTAYYLLTSLCEEGFAVHESHGVYRAARGLEELTSVVAEQPTAGHEGLAGAVDDLFLLTRKRSYLGVVHSGKIEIVAFRGRQGVPRMPGMGSEIRDSAHALAMGKVVLSLLEPPGLATYIGRGLKRFTRHTVTDPVALRSELDRVREHGFAVDREEFDENFCCIAAPIRDERGRFIAALSLSTSRRVFDSDAENLAATVVTVASTAAARARERSAGRPRNGFRDRSRRLAEAS